MNIVKTANHYLEDANAVVCAGTTMAMHLNGVQHDTIQKMGRWSSNTFLMYIHKQILAFSAGLSKKQMVCHIGFHNIGRPMFKLKVNAAMA